MVVLLIFLTAIFLFFFYHLFYKRLGLPPGPMPVPFIGNTIALNLSRRWEHKFLDWKKQYGKIFTYWVGELPIVSVSDYELAHRLFVKEADAFADRCAPEHFLRYTRAGHVSGVIFTSGHLWQDQRRFALRVLKDFGLGKNDMEHKILDEIRSVMDNVNKEIAVGADEHDFHRQTDLAIGSIINTMIFGYRFTDENKDEFYRIKARTTQVIRSFTDPLISIGRFNKLFFDCFYFYCKRVVIAFEEIYAFLDKNIKARHLENLSFCGKQQYEDFVSQQPQDYLDAFFIEQVKLQQNGGNTADFYTVPQLKGMCFDLWFAGQETLSSTLTWIFGLLIGYPECQKKLHDELDRVIGGQRMIRLTDKPGLHYLNAVIAEGQRKANIFSQNVLRQTSRDIDVDGMHIKKGTCIIPQISAIQYDPEVFPEPEIFKPERFLNEKGEFRKLDQLIPFSLGKRVCLGESMARMELFLFVGNLCNQYEFMPAKQPPILERYPNPGANTICPYKCHIRRRF